MVLLPLFPVSLSVSEEFCLHLPSEIAHWSVALGDLVIGTEISEKRNLRKTCLNVFVPAEALMKVDCVYLISPSGELFLSCCGFGVRSGIIMIILVALWDLRRKLSIIY